MPNVLQQLVGNRDDGKLFLRLVFFYGFFMLWIVFNYSFSYALDYGELQGSSSWMEYYASQFFDVLVVLICMALYKKLTPWVGSSAYLLVLVSICALATLFSSAPILGGESPLFSLMAVGVFRGIGSALMTLLVGVAYTRANQRYGPAAVVVAVCVSVAFAAVMLAAPKPLLFVIVSVLPLAVVLLARSLQAEPNDPRPKPLAREQLKKLIPLALKMLCMIVVFFSVNNVSKSLYRHSGAITDPAVFLGFGLLMAAILLLSMASYGRLSVVSMYRAVFLLTLICFLAMPVVGKNLNSVNAMIAVDVMTFRAFVFICLLRVTVKTGVSPILVFGAGELVRRFSSFLMLALVPNGSVTAVLQDEFLYISEFLVPIVILTFVFIVVCTESNLQYFEEPLMLLGPQEMMEQRRLELAKAHGLTDRETEVFLLLAKGKSRPRIAEELYLSPGTVNVYAKKIYKKIGIHSRQELLDIASCDDELPHFTSEEHLA